MNVQENDMSSHLPPYEEEISQKFTDTSKVVLRDDNGSKKQICESLIPNVMSVQSAEEVNSDQPTPFYLQVSFKFRKFPIDTPQRATCF